VGHPLHDLEGDRYWRPCARPRRDHTDPIEAVLDEARGKVLFRGKVVDVARRATEGFLRGTATVEGLDDDRGNRLELAFQNEWVAATRSRCRPI
jgi:DUF917 family protein